MRLRRIATGPHVVCPAARARFQHRAPVSVPLHELRDVSVAESEEVVKDEDLPVDSRAGTEVLNFLRRSVTEFGQTIIMVTHDPTAAAHADRVIFLADGAIVDELHEANADTIIDKMKSLGG